MLDAIISIDTQLTYVDKLDKYVTRNFFMLIDMLDKYIDTQLFYVDMLETCSLALIWTYFIV